MKKNLHIIIIILFFSFILWFFISLSNDYYATFDIPVKLTDFPQGYTTGTEIPKKVSIKLKSKGWKLITINLASESEFIVPAGADSGRQYVNLYNFLVDNQWLSSDIEVIDIAPDTISFFVEKTSSKKVTITPDLELKFKPGYGLAENISFSPESTMVRGPGSIVKTIYSIPTEKLRLDKLDEKTIEKVNLKSMQGMSYENNSVNVSINVQKIVDKDVDNIEVKVLDVPGDRSVVLLPNIITIGIRGGIDVIGKMEAGIISASANYQNIVQDTLGSIKPDIKLPDNVKLLYIRPERLRYIIKKFN